MYEMYISKMRIGRIMGSEYQKSNSSIYSNL